MDSVYERTGSDTMSRRAFYLVIGAVLSWGFFATWYVSGLTANWQPGVGMYLLVGLGIPIVGILLSTSESPLLSFIGFNMVAIPIGATLGPVLAHYQLAQPGVVGQAAFNTGCITGIMGCSGFMFPNFYRSIGGFLFWGLVALLVIIVLGMFIPGLKAPFIAYLGAGLFALYIGYDMWRASEIPATLDNAVDVCVSLYLDIINLFRFVLEIMAGDSD